MFRVAAKKNQWSTAKHFLFLFPLGRIKEPGDAENISRAHREKNIPAG